MVEEAALADEVGVHAIGLGEHHRPDLAISSPEVVLAAIASRTKHRRTIRVFQRFSTLNAVSSGRAEVILGRGSESFPLFGYNLSDYETLLEEKLDLFAAILKNDAVTWQGHIRTSLTSQRIFPPIETGTLKNQDRCRRQPAISHSRGSL